MRKPKREMQWNNYEHSQENKNNGILRSYFLSSSVIGLNILGQERRSWIEKFVWTIGLLLAVGVFVILVLKTWSRWRSSTVIIQSISTDVPFPAITICPGNKLSFSQPRLKELLEKIDNEILTAEELLLLRDLTLVCEPLRSHVNLPESNLKREDTIDNIELFSIKIEEFVNTSQYWLQRYDSTSAFKPIITDEGLCYTFNSLPGQQFFTKRTLHSRRKYLAQDHITRRRVKWTMDTGYDKDATHNDYPRRVLGDGRHTSLRVVLHYGNADVPNICSHSNGYTITVHSPADVARPSQRGVRVPHGAVVDVAVTPEAVWTDAAVRYAYTPSERQCFYPNERRLRFFVQYTQANCELECLANYTLRSCGCVAFYMPRLTPTRICMTLYEKKCIKLATWKMHTVEADLLYSPMAKYDKYFVDKSTTNVREMKCNCVQRCNFIDYEARVTSTFIPNERKYGPPLINVFIEKKHYKPTQRMEIFGTIDFIANCGGVLGVCLGFSMLTLVEIVYWLVVRPWFQGRPTEHRIITNRINVFTLHKE